MRHSADKIFWGLVLVALGGLFLARNLGLIDFHYTIRTYWPVLLILLGISYLLKSFSSDGRG